MIDSNPVQHQAFAVAINGLEQQLADNIDGVEDRIDALDAQIEAALDANVYAPRTILRFRGRNALLIALNPVQHQAFDAAINGLEQQLADNDIYGLEDRIDALRARIEEALIANVSAPHAILLFRRMNALLIDPNPVQHQAFAVAINGLEQQLADNNIDGLLDRIDELDAQIQEALVAAPPRVNMVDFLFDPNL